MTKKSQEKSGFKFNKYFFTNCSLERKPGDLGDIDVTVTPSGTIDAEKKLLILTLEIECQDTKEVFKANVEAYGLFTMSGDEDDLVNDFVLLNAPAIMFPYVRAYISSMTALSNLGEVTIPTMNLVSLKETLKANISFTKQGKTIKRTAAKKKASS